MAEVLTIGGVDRTANLYRDSLRIEQAAGEFTAVCSFKLDDLDSTLAIQTRDAVTVTDNGTTLFAGEVVDIDYTLLSLALPGRRMSIRCQDYNILVEEAVIDGEEAYSAQADSAIIADLFGSYRADVDATTHVSTLQASMTISFEDVTLRQALSDICSRTGGRWYVDESKKLHYFTAEVNVCAWWLSDDPDNADSFPYQAIKQRLSASTIVNHILVVGKEVRTWYEDAASVAAYGERPAVVVDNRITTQAGLDTRGAALLAKWADPRVVYDVVTRKEGLRAGMDVRLICTDWGIDETLTVRRLTIYWRGDNRFYSLEIGEGIAPALTTGRIWLERLGQAEGNISSIDDTIFDTDAPATPTFEAENLTTGVDIDADGHQVVYIQATWGSVADTDLDHYQIQISTSNDFSGYTITRDHAAGGDRKERFVGILGNTTYYARVRAIDWVGNKSAWSTTRNVTTAKDTTAPAQVTGLNAAASRTLVGLNWDANTEADLSYYEIQRDVDSEGAPAGTWATIALAKLNFYVDQDFTDGEISGEDTFWYRVRAVDTSANEGDWADQTSAQLSQIAADHLAAGCITTVKIFAGAVTAEKITVAQLSAITADLGTITAGIVTGATIRTAAAGARVVLDSTDGLQCYNAGDILCAQIDVDGSGQIGASGGEVPPLTWNNLGQFNRIQANQLQIGQSLFNLADGLLLLNDYCVITPPVTGGANGEWETLRKQVVLFAHFSPLHQIQGRWLGTRAMLVEIATTNLVTNPSFEVDLGGWVNTGFDTWEQITTDGVFGSCCARAYEASIEANEYVSSPEMAVDADTAYTASLYAKQSECSGAGHFVITWFDAAHGYISNSDPASFGATPFYSWKRFVIAGTSPATAAFARVVVVHSGAAGTAYECYLDGVQLEELDCTTSYTDGSLGNGYAWTGAAHASTSTRALTEINLNDYAGMLNNRNTLSIRLVAQMPYDADATWTNTANALMDLAKTDLTQRVLIVYDTTDNTVKCVLPSATLTSSAQTFKAGDWLDIVVTLDYATDDYNIYVDGVLEDNDTTAHVASTALNEWNLGSYITAANQAGAAYSELAVFDKVLSAAEVAQLYNLQRPLIDAGAMETPGIYILDGKFRISSSTTGNRIEIDADEIAGYDSGGTKQFYLQASDGKAVAGGGDVWMDEDGLALAIGSGSSNQVKWLDGNDDIGRLYAYKSATTAILTLFAIGMGTGDDAIISLNAQDDITGTTQLQIISPNVAGYDAAGTIIARVGGTGALQVKSHGIKVVGDIRLTDGKAAPATEAGYAILYVDSADGDLKVKFGNGFVATIAADS